MFDDSDFAFGGFAKGRRTSLGEIGLYFIPAPALQVFEEL